MKYQYKSQCLSMCPMSCMQCKFFFLDAIASVGLHMSVGPVRLFDEMMESKGNGVNGACQLANEELMSNGQ